MAWQSIVKSSKGQAVAPNLSDYAGARATFSWDLARRELDGLPGGYGLNIAHEAVDRHAFGARREHLALRWLGKKGEVRDFHVHEAVVAHHVTGRLALDLHPDDVFWCTADPGWVTGTSYGIIAPLTETLLAFHGPEARAVVWEHNCHVGNAAATEMGARGEFNVGQLCRERFGRDAFLLGFGTDHGTVAAARDWDGPMQVMAVRPSLAESYERLFHEASVPALLLPLGLAARPDIREELRPPRLERAIGVVYRPETELQSHYFQAILPEQFDDYIWLDRTQAVTPLGHPHAPQLAEGHPFALLDE